MLGELSLTSVIGAPRDGEKVPPGTVAVRKMVPGEWRWMEAAGPRTEALPHLVR